MRSQGERDRYSEMGSQKDCDDKVNMEEMKNLIKAEVMAEWRQEKTSEKRKTRDEPMQVDDNKKKLLETEEYFSTIVWGFPA